MKFRNDDYHEMKTTMCESVGYQLIHIWEDEWKTNKQEIKEKLIKIFKNEISIL
jgi:very-short-patch-repair endonuclease